jgi:hypothetical protein
VRFAKERGQHRYGQQQEQPGQLHQQHTRQGNQRDEVLRRSQNQREQADTADSLPPRPLEMIVDLGVLELGEIERGGVLHEAHTEPIGEEIAQQALEQR